VIRKTAGLFTAVGIADIAEDIAIKVSERVPSAPFPYVWPHMKVRSSLAVYFSNLKETLRMAADWADIRSLGIAAFQHLLQMLLYISIFPFPFLPSSR